MLSRLRWLGRDISVMAGSVQPFFCEHLCKHPLESSTPFLRSLWVDPTDEMERGEVLGTSCWYNSQTKDDERRFVETDSLYCREGQGVMVRIECGPRDAMRRECVLAVSKKAGEVAERQTLLVTPPPPSILVDHGKEQKCNPLSTFQF